MTLDDLITNARQKAQDFSVPPLWSDDEWTAYANNAQNEACRRARLIVDSTTDEITLIDITATTNNYPLDERILFIKRAKLASRAQPLSPKQIAELDEHFLGWEADTGEPRHYIKDMDTQAIRLYPQSTIADSLRLTVVRLPLADMAQDADEPEIRPQYHRSLVYWMLYEAYSKQDIDTLDKQKAADNLAIFEQEFGKKSSAIDEAWIERNHGYIEADGIY